MNYLPAIFAVLVSAAGWHYLFYSSAASKLLMAEGSPANRLRVFLRRVGGLAMIIVAVAFYVGSVAMEKDEPVLAVGCFTVVFVLLLLIVSLGLFDLRLTNQLRRAARKEDQP